MDKQRKRSVDVCEASTFGMVPKKTVGIPNLESICYMSSVLQVLANIKSYHEVILIIPTESSLDSDKILALQLMLTALFN